MDDTARSLDDMDDSDAKLTLVSLEDERFVIPKKVAMMSNVIRRMAEGDSDDKDMPLRCIKGSILNRIVTYLKYHYDNPPKEIEKPLKSPNMNEVVEQWDADFVDVEQEQLFDLLVAANYMDIEPLLDLACAKVACLMKGKSPEQIRKLLNIQNDLTPEETEAVRAENRWAEE